jgi:hypothetical protein
MPTDQKFSSFKALNGRDAVEFVDYDPEKPMSQDDQDFINGSCIYADTPEDADKSVYKIKPIPSMCQWKWTGMWFVADHAKDMGATRCSFRQPYDVVSWIEQN